VSWLTPIAGLWLALAVIPPLILLYFLKLRRRPQAISTTLLWKKSVEDLQANAPFQRLRRNLLLLLQLIALLLLVAAVMQPQIRGGTGATGRTVLLIDNSGSMTATDTDSAANRLEDAKRLARQRIETMFAGGIFSRPPGETMILAFSDRAEVYSRFASSKRELLSAIDQIRPTHGQTSIEQAFKLARAYTINPNPDNERAIGAPATFELFSDGRIVDLADSVLRGETMLYHPIGSAEPDNMAIGAISVQRPFDKPTSVEVFTALVNFNQAPISADIQLSVDDVVLGIQEAQMPAAAIDANTGLLAPSRRNIVFTPFELPYGAVIEVALLRADDLAADNFAQVVVPPPKKLVVALVESKNFVLRSVMEGMPQLKQLDLLSAARFEALIEQDSTDQYDAIVFDAYAPPSLPPGRYLSFGPTPPVLGLNEYDVTDEGMLILDTRQDHPVMRYVLLENLIIRTAHLLAPEDDVQVLAEGSRGPAIITLTRGPLRLIHVTFDVLDSNWPFLRSFVTFVVNAVEDLGQTGEALTSRGFQPGEALTARLPGGATKINLRLPNGSNEQLTPFDPTSFSWGPIRLSGLYLLSFETPEAEDMQIRPFAVNMDGSSEGDITTAQQITIGQDKVRAVDADSTQYTPLWPYALALCLTLLMVEWWVYHKKTFI
jgi:hypothetical protein